MRRRYNAPKRAGESRAFQDMKGNVHRYLKGKLDTRLTALAPCPVTPRQVYSSLFTKDQLQCIALLHAACPKVLVRQDELWLAIKDGDNDGIKVNFNREMPCPPSASPFYNWQRSAGMQWGVDDLPEWMRPPLHEWVGKFRALDKQHNEILNYVNDVFDHCNTFGQVVRLWPMLLSCFPREKRVNIERQRMKSKHCELALDGDGNLLPKFQPSVYAPYEDILAEAFALPDSLPSSQPIEVRTS